MSIAKSILPEFNHEMANTRKLLERVPEEQGAWKPHPKSYSLGELAMHIANIPTWVVVTLKQDSLEFDAANRGPKPAFETRRTLLERFDDNVFAAVSAIADADDDEMRKPWTLKNGDKVMFSLPKVAVLRSFIVNHLIHHRGQLTVYLRLKNVPLPAIYGNSADER